MSVGEGLLTGMWRRITHRSMREGLPTAVWRKGYSQECGGRITHRSVGRVSHRNRDDSKATASLIIPSQPMW